MSVIIELNFSYCLNFVFNKISNGQLSKRAQILNFQISHVSWIELIYSYCLNFVFNKISNGQLSKRAQILNFQFPMSVIIELNFSYCLNFVFNKISNGQLSYGRIKIFNFQTFCQMRQNNITILPKKAK